LNRINLYYRKRPPGRKWFPGDRYTVHFLRRIFSKKKISGLDKVFLNLCKGFDELKVDYVKNKSFKQIKPNEPVVILGVGKYALQGYTQPNAVIAGIGLMTYPEEWPSLFSQYPIAKYLQHSQWANNIYVPYYGKDNCTLWPAGIDTEKWSPGLTAEKKFDLLIYDKIMWNKEQTVPELKLPLLRKLDKLGLTYREITYGHYQEAGYFKLLQQCRAMIYLSEHESQGFACGEALSMNVPVLAWDQGYYLDPARYKWNEPMLPATSIPYFDENCGIRFKDIEEFEEIIDPFWQKVINGNFNPRGYMLANLTLKKSAERMLQIINEVYENK
jgi:glycosyltransferase involved in cell wall biosynthesis